MEKKIRWYTFRWRVLVLILYVITLSVSYVGWRFYNALRIRPMGTGPTGPIITAGSFEQTWSHQPHVLIGIGDSITRVIGAEKEHTYFELLIKNNDTTYPDMQGQSLSKALTNLSFHNDAQDYSITQQHIDHQLTKLTQHEPDTKGIVVLTSGHCDEFWRKHYKKQDPHFWYYYNLEDPNRRGFDAIRRLYLQKITTVLSPSK